ncbi:MULTISPECIES: hypothetical protein [Bacillaceae]|uniref:hypothetical protein n=1 Tax=Bacillaceae TaxID=186817 RepID=UPI002FFFD3B9
MEFISGSIVGVIIAIYLAIDAPKHQKSAVLWAILGFFFGPITLGIYFIKTGRKVAGWIILIIAILVYVAIFVLALLAAIFIGAGMQ